MRSACLNYSRMQSEALGQQETKWCDKESLMKLRLSTLGQELKYNKELASMSRDALLDEMLQSTHQRNEALVHR